MFTLYHKLLSKRPILIQSITTVNHVCYDIGDMIAQQGIEKQGWGHHDMSRTVRMASFGGLFAGPTLSYWYRYLDRIVKTPSPAKGLLYKVLLDQVVFAPFFIGAFFSVQGLFEGKSVKDIQDKLSQGYTTALIGNYKLWPAVQVVNFYFTPLNYRLLVTNIIATGWNAYLSTINHKSQVKE
ncbi:putative integral membrane protein, Mpv17/PMP22 family [Pilobolus umbonatus]|nr:putative integral membrane protein, Mpv17/PMP22 family [Pilobolus umbonatus]